MDLLISHLTPNSGGASNLFAPIRDRLELGLEDGDYGTAIEGIYITIALPKTLGKLTAAEKREFGVCPRKRFTRKSKKLRIDCLSEISTAGDEEGKYHVRLTNAAVPDVLNALQLMQDAVKSTDDFDVRRFLSDANEILQPRFTIKEIEANDRVLRAQLDEEFAESLAEQLADPQLTSSIISFEVTSALEAPPPASFDWLDFRNETSCISAWYNVLLGSQFKGVTPRLFIDFADKRTERHLVAMARLSLPFDFEDYFRLERGQRMQRTAETLRDGLVWLAETWRQDPSPVLQAFQEMQSSGFEFRGELKKRLTSPDKKLTARIEFNYGLDGADLVAVFTKRGGRQVLARRPIGKCQPHPWLLHSLPGCFEWKGDKLSVDFVDFQATVDTKGIR